MSRFIRRLRQLWVNQRGSVLMIFGVSFIVLVVAAGAAYDLGKQQIIRMKMQQAGDAAALGGAIVSNSREDTAGMLFRLNFPETYLGVTRPAPAINLTTSTIQVTANATMPTSFMGNVGITSMPTASNSVARLLEQTIDFDLVVAVDQTASTSGGVASAGTTIMDREKAALNFLSGLVYGPSASNQVRMGVIGYTQHISEKSGLSSDATHTNTAIGNLKPMNLNYDHYGLEAALNMITNNTTPSTPNGSVDYFMEDLSYDCTDARYTSVLPAGNTCLNSSVGCIIPTASQPCSLFNRQVHKRNTDVPPPRTLRDDGAPLSPVRAVILLGDGLVMVEPDGCTVGSTFYDEPRVAGAPCPNYPKFLEQCQKIKDSDAILFVALFYTAPSSPAEEAALKACASINPATGLPRYYFAPTQADLESFFSDAYFTISKVRLFK